MKLSELKEGDIYKISWVEMGKKKINSEFGKFIIKKEEEDYWFYWYDEPGRKDMFLKGFQIKRLRKPNKKEIKGIMIDEL